MSGIYYRWDYLKLQFTMEADRFHTYLNQLDELGKAHVGLNRWKGAIRVKTGGEVEPGKRRYWVTVLGAPSFVVNFLPFAWWPFVTRLDVKACDLEYTDDEVHGLRVQLLENDNPYNIVAMNSRDRMKNDKRDAGGKGFSIGSHKSDLRVAMYRRGREGVGLEYQCKDDMLDRIKERHAQAFPPMEHPSTFWLTIKSDIIACGERRFTQSLRSAGIDPTGYLGFPDDRTIAASIPDPTDPPFHTQGRLQLDAPSEAPGGA